MFSMFCKHILNYKFYILCGCVNPPANVALSGVAVQSSVWDSSFHPYQPIDGISDPVMTRGSCTATKREQSPWWRLDMRGPYNISLIEVVRRTDCCITESDGAEICIGNSLENNGNNNPRCGVIHITSAVTMVFNCSQMTGRYVNIFLPGAGKTLQLFTAFVHFSADCRTYLKCHS
uniref:Fucolectin tachylectin-4 pentraxin-1 domain-containing protein n=1 Tax=Dicentrarchus labrax TaxID=13489 RepID=A0A8P4KEC5_DICLA